MIEFNALQVANTLGRFDLRSEFREDYAYRIDRMDWQPSGNMQRVVPANDAPFIVAPIRYIGA